MKQLKALFVAGSALATGSAFAAVPTEVTTALSDATGDAATIGAGVLVLIVGIAAFKYMRRAL